MSFNKTIILGAGVTGLAAGYKTGYPIFEANSYPGGICHSYIKNGYRFEFGGGHWIFGNDKKTLDFIEKLTPLNRYTRNAAVFFPDKNLFVPYPIQNYLSQLKDLTPTLSFRERGNPLLVREGRVSSSKDNKIQLRKEHPCEANRLTSHISPITPTFKGQLLQDFGQPLCDLFFFPFNNLYTAGLYDKIAPQDQFKTPTNRSAGYNQTFVYPKLGLSDLINKMAKQSDVRFAKEVVKIEPLEKKVYFADKSISEYKSIISTLPLNKMIELTKIKINEKIPPYTSTLVINIGAKKGKKFPAHHWLYIPDSESGFHRVGFYSNVDPLFLPSEKLKKTSPPPSPTRRGKRFLLLEGEGQDEVFLRTRASLYVEFAYLGGYKPSLKKINQKISKTILELQKWQFISDIEVVDFNWIDVAYTWSWPKSTWGKKALAALEKYDIHQIGRYGRWHFQGILESIKEGLNVSI